MNRKLLVTLLSILLYQIGFSQGVHVVGANLTIRGGTYVTLNGQDLTVDVSGTTPGQIYLRGTLLLTGDIDNKTSVSPFVNPSVNTGTLVLNGTGSSSFLGSPSINLYNLKLDKITGGLNMNCPVAVNGELSLVKGIINNPSHALTMELASTVMDGKGSALSHVTGEMKKKGSATYNSFVFPLGTGTYYRPVGFTGITGTATFTAMHVEDNPAGGWVTGPLVGNEVNGTEIYLVSGVEHWVLYPSPTIAAKVQLSWDDQYSQVSGHPSNLLAAIWNGSAWQNMGSSWVDMDERMMESYLSTSTFNWFTLSTSDVPHPMGDVNTDYYVNVLDVVWVVRYLNEDIPTGFAFDLGDLNGNDEIDVSDLTMLISLILDGAKPVKKSVRNETASIHLCEDGTVTLTSEGNLTALQFGFTTALPDMAVNLMVDTDHALSYNTLTGKGVIYSMSNTPFSAGEIQLMQISGVDLHEVYWGTVVASNTEHQTVTLITSTFHTTSVDNPVDKVNLSVYPNPSSGSFTVGISIQTETIIEIQLVDVAGSIIKRITSSKLQPEEHHIPMILSPGIPSGFYAIRVMGYNANGELLFIKREKVLIQRK
jgi:hypothetical protein